MVKTPAGRGPRLLSTRSDGQSRSWLALACIAVAGPGAAHHAGAAHSAAGFLAAESAASPVRAGLAVLPLPATVLASSTAVAPAVVGVLVTAGALRRRG